MQRPDPRKAGIVPRWFRDEVATAGRENLDPEHVAHYDTKEDAEAAADVELLRTLGLDAHSVVVDLGAGTGQFTLAAAPYCARVVAVDVSPVMVAELRRKLASAAASASLPPERVEVIEAGFLSQGLPDGIADFVYSRYALHHLPDFWKVLALRRARRLLRTGGVLRLWDVVFHVGPSDIESTIDAWCGTLPERAEDSSWVRADIEEHVRDEHSTFSWLLEPMLERTGFAIEDAAYSQDRVFARYLARAT